MEKYVKFLLLFTGRHFWNRKCRKKTWWQQEFAVFKCEATANSVTGHVCVNSNKLRSMTKKTLCGMHTHYPFLRKKHMDRIHHGIRLFFSYICKDLVKHITLIFPHLISIYDLANVQIRQMKQLHRCCLLSHVSQTKVSILSNLLRKSLSLCFHAAVLSSHFVDR